MAALLQQRPGGPLGVAGGAKLAAFEAIEGTIGREEAVSLRVPGDNPGGPALDFDDVSLWHACTFTG